MCRSALALLALLAACHQPPPAPAEPLYRLLDLRRLTGRGGRLDWSPDGQWIVFDRQGDDGLYDLYRMRPDGSDCDCLSCDHPDLPQDVQIGQPAWHPDGGWIVFQVEKAGHAGDGHSNPGAGAYHDLWVMDARSLACSRLTDVSDGEGWGTPMGGSLHPVFSHDGSRLLWTDMQDYCVTCGLMGDWQLAVADFDPGPPPRLHNRQDFNPGESGHWYESHGWGPDDTWIYFSGNTTGTWEMYADINRMQLDQAPDFERLTFTAGPRRGEPGCYDEHAHFTRAFDAFVWLNDESGISELWMSLADSSERWQLTHFNTEGHPHSELVRGLRSVPADNAWNPSPPAGREQLAVYVQVDWEAQRNATELNEIYILELERRSDGADAGAAEDAGSAPDAAGLDALDWPSTGSRCDDPPESPPGCGCSAAPGPQRAWLALLAIGGWRWRRAR